MLRCTLAVVAESVVRDAQSNNISVFNILEAFAANAFPAVFARLAVLFMLTRDEGDPAQFPLMLRITQGDHGEDAFPVDCNFAEHRRTRSIVQLGGLAVRGAGQIRFLLLHGHQELGAWVIEVSQRQMPAPQIIEAPPAGASPATQ